MATASPEATDSAGASTTSFNPSSGTNIGASSTTTSTTARTPYYRSPFVVDEKESPSAPAPTPPVNAPFTFSPSPPPPSPPPEDDAKAGTGSAAGESFSSNSNDPKTCRICLDTTDQPSDPELGRLISPCRCRGSSKYVHEECLQRWRLTSVNSKSYYQCNTCGYRYKLRRLRWGKWINSKVLQLALTTTILSTTVYLLGFIADPIINAYLSSSSLPNPPPQFRRSFATSSSSTKSTLTEHMLKGLTSLGLLGFIKVIYFLGPQSWWNIRTSGVLSAGGGGGGGGRVGSTGRDRLGQLWWIVVALGVLNFFIWVWRKVRGFTRGVLERAAEEIVDIQEDDEVRG